MLSCPQELSSIISEMKTINLTPEQTEKLVTEAMAHTKPKYGYFINNIMFLVSICWTKLVFAVEWSDWYSWIHRLFCRK